MKKKIIIAAIIIVVVALIIILTLFVLGNKEKQGLFVPLKQSEKISIAEKMKREVSKKYKGKPGDVKSATLSSITLSGEVLNIEKRQNLKLVMKLNDESGIFRVRVHFFFNEKMIGYMQQNPNTKNNNVDVEFDIDGRVVLNDLKTFEDYEGADIKYVVSVWDNNMNLKEYKPEKGFYVYDNIPPDKIKAYWTVFYNEKGYDIEIYTNKLKTVFDIYKVDDLPLLECNAVEKYEYGYTDISGTKLLLRVGMEPFAEEKKSVEIEVEKEGKYQFFMRAIDKKGNISEKKIKFYVDTTPPNGNLSIGQDVEFFLGETVNLSLNATDNLSGVARYRIAGTQNNIYNANWTEYKSLQAAFKVPYTEGFYEVWAQLEDNAFNISKPFKIDYYAKRKNTIDINSVDKDKEKIIGIDRQQMEQGRMEIKKIEEK